ncbi:MAG: hypothetical protein HY084_06065 [Gemmatimonadetes bacterium]|nr:hypothetical protein [Gemmatimonadota bacterium]
MPGTLDPTIFPLREGGFVPRDLVAPHADTLARRYGGTIESLAARGGISVYELLLLHPALEETELATCARDVYCLTVSQAMRVMSKRLAEWQARRDADAEAAMLAMFESGASDEGVAQEA